MKLIYLLLCPSDCFRTSLGHRVTNLQNLKVKNLTHICAHKEGEEVGLVISMPLIFSATILPQNISLFYPSRVLSFQPQPSIQTTSSFRSSGLSRIIVEVYVLSQVFGWQSTSTITSSRNVLRRFHMHQNKGQRCFFPSTLRIGFSLDGVPNE
jgi:hypothetical protein